MRMTTVGILMMVVATGALASAAKPAAAETIYPWCAIYSERTVGATNCGFSTLAQCRATISGIGGMCAENPAYAAPVTRPRPHHRSQPR